ncbi:MAG TPA: NAD(P)-dependent oxidoreductase [Candidatus Eremiobacteraceae bacterium]|nr:NAD(P)-dependent oxidoreductase [Candidatus Eremiobacteraceae bacterium]
MNILVAAEGYSEARKRLQPLVPQDRVTACAPSALMSSLAGVEVVVPYVAQIDAAAIAAGTFGLVQQFGVGLETIDVEAATQAGVWVARVPSRGVGNAESVAEHAVLLMLALSRRWPAGANIAKTQMGEPSGLALHGKTACIIGLGDIGSALAVRLRSFGMRLIAVRRRPDELGAPELGVERVYGPNDIDDAVARADYVALCVNYDAASHHLIGERTLAAFKPGSYLINVARGGLVDHDALARALAAGRLAGAGLDVFWSEPPDASNPLFAHNVIATPHVAGVTDVSYEGIAHVVAENIERYRRGDAPLHAVNQVDRVRGPASVVRR